MNFTLWNVSKSVELFWWKCIILPVLSAAIYETAPDGRCRCRRRTAPRRIRDAGAARSIRPAKLPQRASRSVSFAEAPAWRPQDAPTGWDSIRPPAAGARFSFPEPILRGWETLPPSPGLVRLRLSARSHGGGNRLVTACVKQQFSGNNSALPLIHQVFAVIVPSASCHAPS